MGKMLAPCSLVVLLTLTAILEVSSQSWSWMPTTTFQGKEISGAVHDDIWAIRTELANYNIYHWENNAWKNMPGGAKHISASFETKRPWIIGLDDVVYRFDGTSWNQVPSPFVPVQVSALNSSAAIAISNNGSLMLYIESQGWIPVFVDKQVINATVKDCSIGKDTTIWCVDTNRAIWRQSNGTWISVYGIADVVDVYSANRVLIVNSQTQQVFNYMIGNTQWLYERMRLTGLCVQASISDIYLYCTAGDGSLWWASYPAVS